MTSASDGSNFTGSVTVYVTGDGGTQAVGSVGSGACTHEGNGYHTYTPAQAETNYDHVAFTFTGTGAISATKDYYTTFPQTGDSYSRLGAPAGTSVSDDIAALPTATENADELLTRDWTSVTGEAARSVLNALRFLRNKWSLSGTTLTVTEEDDTTTAWTSVVTTDAAAEPVSGSDPT